MMTFADDDRTMLGLGAAEVGRELAGLDVDAVGVNCSSGPNQVLRLTSAMREVAPELAIAAMPNAGFPERDASGRVAYPATPEYFADYASAFVDAGIRIIGGCCGTSDEHIAAIRGAIDEGRPTTIVRSRSAIVSSDLVDSASADPPTELKLALASGRFVTTVEMRPPKGIATQKMVASAAMLRDAGADFLEHRGHPAGTHADECVGCRASRPDECGNRDDSPLPDPRSQPAPVQADLLAAHALGVRNLFVTMETRPGSVTTRMRPTATTWRRRG